LAGAGLLLGARHYDAKTRLWKVEARAKEGSQADVERALRVSIEKEGLARELALGDVVSGRLVYHYKDASRTVAVAIENMDDETQRTAGVSIVTAFEKLPDVVLVERGYDSASSTLTLKARVRGRL